MTYQKLASEIAKREGKKSQARIGDIREILNILTELLAEEYISCRISSIHINSTDEEKVKQSIILTILNKSSNKAHKMKNKLIKKEESK